MQVSSNLDKLHITCAPQRERIRGAERLEHPRLYLRHARDAIKLQLKLVRLEARLLIYLHATRHKHNLSAGLCSPGSSGDQVSDLS